MPALEEPVPAPEEKDTSREVPAGEKDKLKDVRHEIRTTARLAADALRSDDIDLFLGSTCFDEWVNMFAARYSAHDGQAVGGGPKFFERALSALIEDKGGLLTAAFEKYRATLHERVPEMDPKKTIVRNGHAVVMVVDKKGVDQTATLTPGTMQKFLQRVGDEWKRRNIDLRLRYEHVVRVSVDQTADALDALLKDPEPSAS